MGFFSMNEHSNLASNFEFPVVEGYDGTIGCGIALVEGYQNDLALFTAAVQYDMSEMYSIKEGVSDEVLQEGAVDTLKRMWEAIKQFFIKLGAKIKALFTAFIAKLQSYFTKDLKGFVKKYEKSLNGKDFKDMKAKFSEPKMSGTYVGPIDGRYSDFGDANQFGFGANYAEKADEDTSRADRLEKWYKKVSENKATNRKELADNMHELFYKDEEVKDDWDQVSVRACARRLTENTKTLSDLDKANKNFLASIQKILKAIDDEEKRINKLWKDSKDGKADSYTGYGINAKYNDKTNRFDGASKPHDQNTGSVDLANAQKHISNVREEASCFQEVAIALTNCVTAEVKFGITQDKRIFTKAIGYKTVKEETLLTAIEECAADEVNEYFDNPAIVA